MTEDHDHDGRGHRSLRPADAFKRKAQHLSTENLWAFMKPPLPEGTAKWIRFASLLLTAEAQEGILKVKMGKTSWTLDGSSLGCPLAAGLMVHHKVFDRGGRRKGAFPG